MSEFFGWLLLLGAGMFFLYCILAVGWAYPASPLGKVVAARWPFGPPAFIEERERQRQRQAKERFKELTTPPDPVDVIRTTAVGHFIDIEGAQVQYKAKMTLLELQFFGSNKDDKRHVNPNSGEQLREFLAVELSGGRLLLRQPMGEGLPLSWYLYQTASDKMPIGFSEYLKGTPGSPGPIQKFAQSNQQAHIEFEALTKTWVARDLVWVDFAIEEGKTFVGNKARAVMVLARNRDDEAEWLLFIDLRSGEGSDTLWVGRQFDPVEVEV